MSVNNDDYPDNPALTSLNSRYVTSEALDTPVYTRNSKHYLASDAMNKLLDSEYKQYKMEKEQEQGSSRDLDEIDISEIKSPTFSAENSRYTESQALENTTYYRNSQKYTKDVEGARQDLSRGSTPTESPIMSPKFQSQHSRTVQSEALEDDTFQRNSTKLYNTQQVHSILRSQSMNSDDENYTYKPEVDRKASVNRMLQANDSDED